MEDIFLTNHCPNLANNGQGWRPARNKILRKDLKKKRRSKKGLGPWFTPREWAWPGCKSDKENKGNSHFCCFPGGEDRFMEPKTFPRSSFPSREKYGMVHVQLCKIDEQEQTILSEQTECFWGFTRKQCTMRNIQNQNHREKLSFSANSQNQIYKQKKLWSPYFDMRLW